MNAPADAVFLQLVIVLTVGFVAERIARRTAIPDIVFFLGSGIALGPFVFKIIDFPANGIVAESILTFGMIVLVYEGGRSLELSIMRTIWLGTTLLALIGVAVTAAVMTLAVHLALGVPVLQAALAGCVIASTDPAAIIPLLERVRVTPRLSHLLIAESAFNDATGAILTFLVAGLLLTGQTNMSEDIGRFAMMALGGIGIGVVAALILTSLVAGTAKRRPMFPEAYHPAIASILLILGSYATAQAAGASGIMAVFAAGIVAGNRARFGLGLVRESEHAHHFYLSTNALLLRILIFVILGSHVELALVGSIALPGFAIMAVFLFIARPLAVVVSLVPDRIAKWSPQEMLFASWVRETGVVPAALAGLLQSKSVPGAQLITAIVFMAVLVTIGGQATTTALWARVLRLDRSALPTPGSTTAAI